ncbi:uncharacterized protein LOC141902633 [Tubulanus polymorphus]|uniref:uncharacterized protein LOC141902633 n=1 Tax=Tubulanus polymorphus TaxID=672921 RepID=UPI003DA65EE8
MPSAADSMSGEERFLRVATVIDQVGPKAMRAHLQNVFPNLSDELSHQRPRLLSLQLQGAINEDQWRILYGPDDRNATKTCAEMDISLLAILINNLSPTAEEVHLDRVSAEGIRRIRNYLGRLPVASLQADVYNDNMKYLEQYVVSLAGPDMKAMLDELAEADITPTDQTMKQRAKALRKEFNLQTSLDVPSNFSPVTEGHFFLHN